MAKKIFIIRIDKLLEKLKQKTGKNFYHQSIEVEYTEEGGDYENYSFIISDDYKYLCNEYTEGSYPHEFSQPFKDKDIIFNYWTGKNEQGFLVGKNSIRKKDISNKDISPALEKYSKIFDGFDECVDYITPNELKKWDLLDNSDIEELTEVMKNKQSVQVTLSEDILKEIIDALDDEENEETKDWLDRLYKEKCF